MSELYFYEKAGRQAGPLAGDQLVAQGVEASTLIWRAGLPDWVAAGTVPELRAFFTPSNPVVAPAPPTATASPVKPLRPPMPPATPARSVFTGKNLKIAAVVLLALGAELASRGKPDITEPAQAEQQTAEQAPEGEIKEIGYADRHLHDDDEPEDREEVRASEPHATKSVTYYWYGCSSCGKLLTARAMPGYSRCPSKTGTSGTEHTWDKLGQVGYKQYACYFCAASVSTVARPESSRCPSKEGTSGLGHQWEESGVPINRL